MIKIGDVNASNGLNSSLKNEERVNKNSAQVRLEFGDLDRCVDRGQTFLLLVEGESVEPMIAYQLGMRYNHHKVRFKNIYNGNFDQFDIENFGLTEVNKGIIKTLWVEKELENTTFDENNNNWFILELKALEDICDLSELVELQDQILENYFLNIEEERL
ncbi:MAG: hypothetical protein AAFO82_04855 [Bacteroidota bacterium]